MLITYISWDEKRKFTSEHLLEKKLQKLQKYYLIGG